MGDLELCTVLVKSGEVECWKSDKERGRNLLTHPENLTHPAIKIIFWQHNISDKVHFLLLETK